MNETGFAFTLPKGYKDAIFNYESCVHKALEINPVLLNWDRFRGKCI
jgi:hypothetical protein